MAPFSSFRGLVSTSQLLPPELPNRLTSNSPFCASDTSRKFPPFIAYVPTAFSVPGQTATASTRIANLKYIDRLSCFLRTPTQRSPAQREQPRLLQSLHQI